MLITQSTEAHICNSDGALAAAKGKKIAVTGVEVSTCDDLQVEMHKPSARVRRLEPFSAEQRTGRSCRTAHKVQICIARLAATQAGEALARSRELKAT